jgi:stearoyl-CoA desaturase (delta-9 desaturase)
MLQTLPSRSMPALPAKAPRDPSERINRVTSIPFFVMHALPLLAFFSGVSRGAVILCIVSFYARMFFITAGYHRYFAHRSYKMARVPQLLMALGGTTAVQKGPLWWAGHHRDHHKYSDTDQDVHSPQGGFWWSHLGWILCDKYSHTDLDRIKDFSKFPELRWLDRFDWVAPSVLAVLSYLIAGWSGLLIGFFLSTVLLWHATFTVNSLAHLLGRRRYATEDTSRNSALLIPWTMGEGWHNNHHQYQASARQGFFWWEIDPTYYILAMLSWVGITRDLKVPPAHVLQGNRVKNGSFDIGMFRNHWNKATRSVQAAQASLGQRVHDRKIDAGEVLAARRLAVEYGIVAKKESLEEFVGRSLESAEELAKLTRKGEREVGLVEG